MNRTNVSLKELKTESQHFCDLTYMYLMFIFENDKRLVDSICFKMTYSVILVEKIVDLDNIILIFENKTKFEENGLSGIAFTNQHSVITLGEKNKLVILIPGLDLKIIYCLVTVLYFLMVCFRNDFVKFISRINFEYLEVSSKELNRKLIETELVYLKETKSLFYSEEGELGKKFEHFIEKEGGEFTYPAYLDFMVNLSMVCEGFREKANGILLRRNEKEVGSTVAFAYLLLIASVGYLLHEFLNRLTFINDIYEEKKHTLFTVVSIIYFLLLYLFYKSVDLRDLWKINLKEENRIDLRDEYSGITIKI